MAIHTVGQSRVFVNQVGRGEPLLFLHGVPDSSDVWADTIAKFSSSYHCIAPDLPGFGRTYAAGDFDYSLESLANFVEELLSQLRIAEAVHLVIHDIGGIVGLAFAVAFPERVKSLTIMDTTFFTDHVWHKTARIWRKPILGELAMYLMGHKQFHAAMKKGAAVMTDQQIKANYDALSFRNRRLLLRFYRALDPAIFEQWQNKLKGLTARVPTRVIWGAEDSFLSAKLAHRFSTQDVHLLDDCGHWPMLEKPERTYQLIKQHIEQVS